MISEIRFVRASSVGTGTGFEPPHSAAKQKQGWLQKPARGFESLTTHQDRQGLIQTALAILGSLNQPQNRSCPGASLNTGLGELAALNGIGAPSPNAIIGLGASNVPLNQIFWVLQQNSTIRADKIQISAAASAAKNTAVPATLNHPSCAEVLAEHLAATGAAVNTANKLVVKSTSVEMKDSENPAAKAKPEEEIASTSNQTKTQIEYDSQLSTSRLQSPLLRPSHPNSHLHFPSHILLLLRSQYQRAGTSKAHQK
ncbi:hypothetical protein DSO57_1000313 [Entomophthora muscae]|uniref:Uncharacterized protein n=1 Tax=Entomophthora muscae TaxID=34485 RepID=A0ACC2TK95_9FUNG|nr:hypothetical protein DSO57_1000313 [Entomophthora muscae]